MYQNPEDKNLNSACTVCLYASYGPQVNKGYFPKHLYHIGLCNGQAVCQLCGRKLNFYRFCFLRDNPQWARASSFTRFLDHTQRPPTDGRTPLDKWSARRSDLYLTTHNPNHRQIFMPRGDSNPHSQQASGRRPKPLTPRPLGQTVQCWDEFYTANIMNKKQICKRWRIATLQVRDTHRGRLDAISGKSEYFGFPPCVISPVFRKHIFSLHHQYYAIFRTDSVARWNNCVDICTRTEFSR